MSLTPGSTSAFFFVMTTQWVMGHLIKTYKERPFHIISMIPKKVKVKEICDKAQYLLGRHLQLQKSCKMRTNSDDLQLLVLFFVPV